MAPAPRSTVRPLAKPTKIRYFKNKAPDAPPSDSDSDDEDQQPVAPVVKIDKSIVAGGAGRIIKPGARNGGLNGVGVGMKVELRDVKIEGGRVLLGGQEQVAGEWSSLSSGMDRLRLMG
jgi:microfibrillar-associated protein 1